MASVLLLSCGVASAATGTLPGPAQNAAATAAEHVGLHIPKSDDNNSSDSGDDNSTDPTSTTVVHPDNHGNDVSTVAHDDSTSGADHGTAVCTVASDSKCQPSHDSGDQGKSGDHRQDGDHPSTTSTTTVDDGSGHHGNTDHPTQDSNPGSDHSGSGSDN